MGRFMSLKKALLLGRWNERGGQLVARWVGSVKLVMSVQLESLKDHSVRTDYYGENLPVLLLKVNTSLNYHVQMEDAMSDNGHYSPFPPSP